jgi:hypothetical protein
VFHWFFHLTDDAQSAIVIGLGCLLMAWRIYDIVATTKEKGGKE